MRLDFEYENLFNDHIYKTFRFFGLSIGKFRDYFERQYFLRITIFNQRIILSIYIKGMLG